MKRTTAFIAAVAAIVGFAAQHGFAATVQIDFGAVGVTANNPNSPGDDLDDIDNGTTSEGGTTWNGIEPGNSGADLTAGATQTYFNLIDSAGGSTSVDVALTWSNQAAVDFSRAWDLNPPDRDGDFIWLRGDDNTIFNTVTLSDLTPNGAYDLTVWTQSVTGFRVNNGTPVMVSGAPNHDGTENDAASHTFTGVLADSGGNLVIDWGRIGTDLTGTDRFTTFTALSITDVVATVPTPGTLPAGLAMLGIIAACRRRR